MDEPSVWVRAAAYSWAFVALLWAIEIVDAASGNELDQYGVHPRTDEGLLGILFAPLLHGGWTHLEGNTLPALVLVLPGAGLRHRPRARRHRDHLARRRASASGWSLPATPSTSAPRC